MGASLLILATDPPPGPYLVAMLAGFAIGAYGHMRRSRIVIATGIIVIAITTALFIGATNPHFGASA